MGTKGVFYHIQLRRQSLYGAYKVPTFPPLSAGLCPPHPLLQHPLLFPLGTHHGLQLCSVSLFPRSRTFSLQRHFPPSPLSDFHSVSDFSTRPSVVFLHHIPPCIACPIPWASLLTFLQHPNQECWGGECFTCMQFPQWPEEGIRSRDWSNMVVSCRVGAGDGRAIGTSGRAAGALNHKAIPSGPNLKLFVCLYVCSTYVCMYMFVHACIMEANICCLS